MKILPPLIIHDGSDEVKHAVKVMLALCPDTVEVIDVSTPAGRDRVDVINRGLKDGTLDTHMPPLFLGVEGAKRNSKQRRGR